MDRSHGALADMSPVLVVDDEVDLLDTYARFLRRSGYQVITADRGQAGLSIARSRALALAIVDLNLPDMDGLDVVRALTAAPNSPRIVVVTGFSSAASRRAALDAGAVRYLAKPFSMQELAVLLRNVLEPTELPPTRRLSGHTPEA